MRMKFDYSNLRELAEGLQMAEAELLKEMRPVLKKIGEKIIDDMVDAINKGKDLSGAPLKPNELSTLRKKKRKNRGNKPLIDTGELADRSKWKLRVTKSKKGMIYVTVNPSRDRKKVFYKFLPKKGYNRSQGMTSQRAAWGTRLVAQQAAMTIARWIE